MDVVFEILSFFTRQLVLVVAMGLLLAMLWGWGQGFCLLNRVRPPCCPMSTLVRLGAVA